MANTRLHTLTAYVPERVALKAKFLADSNEVTISRWISDVINGQWYALWEGDVDPALIDRVVPAIRRSQNGSKIRKRRSTAA